MCATAFWNSDHRRAVLVRIRRVLERVNPRRKKSLDIYISVYIRICENFIECGRVQVRFDGGEILKLILRSYVFHSCKLCNRGESLFSLLLSSKEVFLSFLYECGKVLDEVLWFKDRWKWVSLISQRMVDCKRNESCVINIWKFMRVRNLWMLEIKNKDKNFRCFN